MDRRTIAAGWKRQMAGLGPAMSANSGGWSDQRAMRSVEITRTVRVWPWGWEAIAQAAGVVVGPCLLGAVPDHRTDVETVALHGGGRGAGFDLGAEAGHSDDDGGADSCRGNS